MLEHQLPDDRKRFQEFAADLGHYLDEMARHASLPHGNTRDRSAVLLRVGMQGKEYWLDVVCQAWGVRRFVVSMHEPWPQSFVVGCLRKNCRAHGYSHGMFLLFQYLRAEGLHGEVLGDLRECMALSAKRESAVGLRSRNSLPGWPGVPVFSSQGS